jgi:nucleoside phosphorylase
VICVVAALKREVDLFLDALEGLKRRGEGSCRCYEGTLARRDVRVIRTGIGKASFDRCLTRDCSLVISTGFCGALSPLLVRGDFVVSTSLAACEAGGIAEKKIVIPARTRELLERTALETGAVLRFGTSFTAERVIRTVQEKAALHEASGALSVEMEDYHRLECARERGLPFLSLRVVLDRQVDRIPSFRAAARIPADTAALLKNANLCARGLASLLVRFVEKFEMT